MRIIAVLRSLHRRSALGATLIAAALVVSTGCGASGDGIINPVDVSGTIAIDVSRSDTPKFTWEDGAAVRSIIVYNFGSTGERNQILWGYVNVDIVPPVTYGDVIEGGQSLTGGAIPTLRSGNRYRVEIARNASVSSTDWIIP